MASGTRYVPLVYSEVKSLLESEMGFVPKQPKGTRELCWQRQIVCKGHASPYLIRVYSTLEPSGECRELGADAIRVVLVDIEDPENERVLDVEKRVFRTKSALVNLRERARDMWRYATNPQHRCPKCGRLMVVKTTRNSVSSQTRRNFFGCTGFAHQGPTQCKHTASVIPESAL